MKKPFAVLCTLLLFILFLTGCERQEDETLVAGKKYLYSGASLSKLENDAFTITIHEDGTYSYSESLFSSYLGMGDWSVADNVLTLSDNTGKEPPVINYFWIDGDDLIFIEENSSNFIYAKVADGERFHGAAIEEDK